MSSLIKFENKLDALGFNYNVFEILKKSLYPGALDESVMMVLEYCKANDIDPLQKAVHIVSMSITDKKTNKSEYRDVVMPGIGLYRIQAAKSGLYAGVTEPEFGPSIQDNIGGRTIIYPEWCKVTAKRIVQGQICEFSAKELWIENYAPKNKWQALPNAMWTKRPFGQLAKCTEGQAIRKAFPGIVSQELTFEEMEGKTFRDINDDPKAATIFSFKNDTTTVNQEKEIIDRQTGEIINGEIINGEIINIVNEIKSIIDKKCLGDKVSGWLKHFEVDQLSNIPLGGLLQILNTIKDENYCKETKE